LNYLHSFIYIDLIFSGQSQLEEQEEEPLTDVEKRQLMGEDWQGEEVFGYEAEYEQSESESESEVDTLLSRDPKDIPVKDSTVGKFMFVSKINVLIAFIIVIYKFQVRRNKCWLQNLRVGRRQLGLTKDQLNLVTSCPMVN
jgi:hypothetical protein